MKKHPKQILLDSHAQQVSFVIPAELIDHLRPYAERLVANHKAEGAEYFHKQRMELQRAALLTYDQWHATDYMRQYRAALAEQVDPLSLPYYRHLEALYEEYKVAFKALHGRGAGRAYKKPPGKMSFAMALGQAIMDHARHASLVPPPLKECVEIQEESFYVEQSSPNAQMDRFLREGLLPLHAIHPTKTNALAQV